MHYLAVPTLLKIGDCVSILYHPSNGNQNKKDIKIHSMIHNHLLWTLCWFMKRSQFWQYYLFTHIRHKPQYAFFDDMNVQWHFRRR